MPYDISVDFTDGGSPRQRIENITYASPIGFRLLIDRLKYPNIEFSVQSASIPEVSIGAAPLSTPQLNLNIYGDKVEYSPLSLSFIVDEEMKNYLEIHDWILGLIVEQDNKQNDKTRDISLLALNSHNNVSREIKFVDAYPTSLSTLSFDAKSTDVEYLVGEVSFNYSYFQVK